ncbi:Protein of unknown function, partial [Gryllus bimaculatus]
ALDEKIATILIVPLQVSRLLPEAVPTQFPDLPSYLSAPPTTYREWPEQKGMRRECAAIEQAITDSFKEHEEYEKTRIVKRLKCDHCKTTLLFDRELPFNENFSIISKMDRRALAFLIENVVTVVTTNYIVVKKLCLTQSAVFF